MIQKKICMLGAFAVGKTSLVQRFVKSIFSDKYLSTVGVKIDKKEITVEGEAVNLILWDLAGEDEFHRVQTSYLRGAAGYLLVVDGTRQSTLDTAFAIQERVTGELGDVPFVVVVNKLDLVEEWEISDAELEELEQRGWLIARSSAKTGEDVEDVFQTLAARIVEGP